MEEADEVENYMAEEVMEEAASYIKMGLTSNISPVTFKVQIGKHYKTRQEKDNRVTGMQ